jgi:hypothetical protein
VHAVVANLLHTRKDRVLVVHSGEELKGHGQGQGQSKPQQHPGHDTQQLQAAAPEPAPANGVATAGGPSAGGGGGQHRGLEVADVRRPLDHAHIENILVARVVALHRAFQQLPVAAAGATAAA